MKSRFLSLQLISVTFAVAMIGCNKSSLKEATSSSPLNSKQAALLNRDVGAKYINDNYIVVMKDDVGDVDAEVDDIDNNYNVKAKHRYKNAIKGFSGTLSAAVVDALRKDPRVAYIEQDQEVHLAATELNPPSWGLDRVDQQSLPLNNSYVYNQTGAGVDAYIIDCGILLSHTDFGGRAVTGIDEITPGGTATDGNGHGTHVAGIVGGNSYGVAKGVKLIAVRVLDNSGAGTISGVIAGIDWVTNDHTTHPAVANMSLALQGSQVSTALDDAVRRSISDGIAYCVAAGNSTADASTTSPADVAEAVTVGATDISDGFAYFSNYGSVVDISAPGVNITSDWNTSTTATQTLSGTSMATPYVTGTAALYLQNNPTATPAAVQNAIKTGGTPGKITGLPAGTANLLVYSLISTNSPSKGPSAPTLSSPINGSTNVSTKPTLTWNATTGATWYNVEIATNSSFASATLVYNKVGIKSTSIKVSPKLSSGVNYYWRVSATSATGTSSWSSSWNFTTSMDNSNGDNSNGNNSNGDNSNNNNEN